MIDSSIDVSGLLFSYSYLCERKVWLYYHKINFENEHKNVQLGKQIDESSYSRFEHSISVDGIINIDYIKNNIVYEVKKSNSREDMSIAQVKYYLYILRKKGINMDGQINYPLLKKCTQVVLSKEDEKQIEERIEIVKELCNLDVPPEVKQIKSCKNCAYFDFCFSD